MGFHFADTGSKEMPKLFFGQVFLFGALGYQGQNTTQFQETHGCYAFSRSAAGPTNHSLLENVWFSDLATSGLVKNHLAG